MVTCSAINFNEVSKKLTASIIRVEELTKPLSVASV
jgi:hypothetical protein